MALGRCICLFLALLLGCAGWIGCGGHAPPQPPAIVKVGDAAITKAEYTRTYKRAERLYVIGRGYKAGRQYYNPPNFPLCVRDRMAKAVGAEKGLDAAQTKHLCKRHFVGLHAETLQGLIEAEWLRQAAVAQGISVPARLDGEGRLHLEVRLVQRAMKGAVRPSDDDIARYYASHRREFTRAEKRTVTALVADRRSSAVRAGRELRGGEPWKAVARRYDFEGRARSLGDLSEDQTDPVARAAFKAVEGRVVGPIAAPEGWYVLEVQAIEHRRVARLEEVRPEVTRVLADANRYRKGKHYLRGLWYRSRAKTVCLSNLKVANCRNGPSDEFAGSQLVFRSFAR